MHRRESEADMAENRTACFFGHRTIEETEGLRYALLETIERLIVEEGVDTFLFGSRSEFDGLCLRLVSQLKEKHPHVKRIYLRAEYPYIDEAYKEWLLLRYDGTSFPERLLRAGRAVYVERNREMIQRSRYCIVYLDEEKAREKSSGTSLALAYAEQRGREIFRFTPESPK